MIRGINTKTIVFLTIFCITTNFIYCNKCNTLHKCIMHIFISKLTIMMVPTIISFWRLQCFENDREGGLQLRFFDPIVKYDLTGTLANPLYQKHRAALNCVTTCVCRYLENIVQRAAVNEINSTTRDNLSLPIISLLQFSKKELKKNDAQEMTLKI